MTIEENAIRIAVHGSDRHRLEIAGPPTRVVAIGDIHGCISLLKQMEARIFDRYEAADGETLILYLGDLVDRGPDARAVIEHYLTSPLPKGFERLSLCGNHDLTFHDFLKAPSLRSKWLGWGGVATLASYGINVEAFMMSGLADEAFADLVLGKIPSEHVELLGRLPLALSLPTVHFVHAGLRPGCPIEDNSVRDMLWIRDDFLVEQNASDRLIVHGHTPVDTPLVGPGRIGIDTGAVYGGSLTGLCIEGENHHFIEVKA
ncbi:metallophosphoesterase [uncultured Cohaesibacter sp.]|uniref:metallophosphoesterase n=1 Tax=uncultured Cohaesibacter sp. TaxID=1002546 RepID=UPI00292FD825|nr:metallophosphoesterase [uncultured Cohaesibacter sp.]